MLGALQRNTRSWVPLTVALALLPGASADPVGVGTTGDAEGDLVAVSLTGDADGGLAGASLTGDATGGFAAASMTGGANATTTCSLAPSVVCLGVAVSLIGDASCGLPPGAPPFAIPVCATVSVTGDAQSAPLCAQALGFAVCVPNELEG